MSTIIEPATGSGLRHALTLPLDDIEWRESGNGTDYTLRGHAAVFNRVSDDLGGFRELLEPRAFRAALRKNPDVRLTFNHDSNYVMARTASGTLELREDKTGLHVWARVPKVSWVSDLRVSMQRGDIDQMSFGFSVADSGDDWAVADDGTVVRTIRQDGIAELFDVSVVTYPAYPQTDAAMRTVLVDALKRGRIPKVKRADVVALDCLVEAYQAVKEFVAVETDPEDAADVTEAQKILDALDGLIQVEAAEADDGAADPDEQNGRASAGQRVAPVRVGRTDASRSTCAGAALQLERARRYARMRLETTQTPKE
jgi:HK97 family phage prohead protease